MTHRYLPIFILAAAWAVGVGPGFGSAPDAPLLPRYRIEALPVPPDAVFPGAEAVNNRGQVLLASGLKNRTQRAYLWSDGKLTDLGTLGGQNTFAHDLNDKGQVVGQSQNGEGVYHAFVWENGTLRDLGAADAQQSEAWGINNAGQIVGTLEMADRTRYACRWRDGKLERLPALAGKGSGAIDVNDRGQIAGYAQAADSQWHATLWEDDKPKDLGVLAGFTSSSPFALNEQGIVVGAANRGGVHDHEAQPFLYRAGKLMELPGLGGKSHHAFDVNTVGDVVGVSFNTPGGQRAFLYRGGKAVALDDLLPANSGWKIYWARAINNRGQIVGNAERNGVKFPILMTPEAKR